MFSLHVCLVVMCVPSPQGGQKRASDPLEQQLQVSVTTVLVQGVNTGPLQEHLEL